MQLIETRNIEANKVTSNPKQPRRFFDEAALDELAESIKRDGLLQDILVRPTGDEMYEVIFGERRFQAIRRLGLEEINVKVAEVSDAEMLRLALIENLQRSNLSAIEEAEAIRRLMEECGLTQTEVAKELGKSQGFVASRLALLKLPEAIQTKIMQRKISASHGELLSRISDEEILQQLANEVEKGMSVSKLKRCIQRVSPPSSQSSEAKTEAERVSFDAEAEPLEEIRSASGDDKELVGQTSGEMKDKEKRLEETDELIMVSEESIEVSSEGESRIEDAEQFAARHTSFSDLNFIKERENGSEKHLVRNIQKIIGTIESLAIALDEVCTNVSPSLRNCRALYVAAKDLFSKAQVLLSKVKKNCERMADCVLDEAIQDQKVVVDQIDLEFASDAKRAEYQRPLTEDSVGESIRSN